MPSSLPRPCSSCSSALLLPTSLLLCCLLLLLSPSGTAGNDDASPLLKSAQYFRRNAKWVNLPSGGGSLVSGRGNFRPGFHSTLRDQALMAEPLFAIKRSSPRTFVDFSLMDRDFASSGDPVLAAFARRR